MSNLSDAERAKYEQERMRFEQQFSGAPVSNEKAIELSAVEIRRLRTELASVTARLAAAEAAWPLLINCRGLLAVERLEWRDLQQIGGNKKLIENAKNREIACSQQILDIDAAIAAAVSAGGMKPLGDNTKEPPHER